MNAQFTEGNLMAALAGALLPHLKHTQPTGTPSTPYYTGPGGLFGVSGLERDVISTRIQPRGLASVLPVVPSITKYPMFPYFTGFQAGSGDEAATPCDDAKTAGPGKSCIQTAQFGFFSRQTREMDVVSNGQIDRGEFQDLVLVNDPYVEQMGGLLAQQFLLGRESNAMLGSELLMRFMEVGVEFQNLLMPALYTGNPTNNNAGGGYKEFPGLDILIGVNKVDALTNVDCPSLDSDIKDFNYARVDLPAEGDIVNVVTYLMRYLRHNADRMNFGAVRWVLSMRRELFWELTNVWPCSYLTYQCVTRTNGPVGSFDSNEAIRMRQDMRDNNYLLVDGMKYDVVIDDGIVEESSTTTANLSETEFASDIYVIPMTVLGGRPVTYWEYYDYSKAANPAIQQGNLAGYFWTDGGRFLWHAKPPRNFCIQHIARIEPRLILRTPQLAGRITNVAYSPLQHTRDPFIGDPYHVNGGNTSGRTSPSLWSDWGAVSGRGG